MRTFTVVNAMVVLLGLAKLASGQCVEDRSAALTATDGATADIYGYSVSTGGNVVAVGAPGDDTSRGAVYVHEWNGSNWAQVQKLTASDGAAQDSFGWSVGLDGNVILVGTPLAGPIPTATGAAYFYRHNGTSWVEEAKVIPGDAAVGDAFGHSVAIDGNVALVASWRDDDAGTNAGSAYVYRRTGNQWVEEQELQAGDAAPSDQFGVCVALDGNAALIGANLNDGAGSGAGAAYVFRYDGVRWNEEQKLTAFDARPSDSFGYSVALDGNVAAIGSWKDDDVLFPDAGSVHVFRLLGGTWKPRQKVIPGVLESNAFFGSSVALRGNVLVVGAVGDDHSAPDSGAAYAFGFDGSAFRERQKLGDSSGTRNAKLGQSVAVSADWMAAGAFNGTGPTTLSGSGYTYPVVDLGLSASPATVIPGDTLTFASCGGRPGEKVLLATVGVNGIPLFVPFVFGSFDAVGGFTFTVTAPAGFAGLTFDFLGLGFLQPSKIGLSNRAAVLFQ